MAQKNTTSKTLRRPASDADRPSPVAGVRWDRLDANEQLSVICELFMQQKKVGEIAKEINRAYNAGFSRESVYPLLQKAVKKGWLRYIPPPEDQLERALKSRYPWLSGGRVVHSGCFSDTAGYGAEMLLDLVRNYRHSGKKEIHIGFAGGHAMRGLANQFARLLTQSEMSFPERLVLHALVSGFDVYEPTTDPNTFFTLFRTGQPKDVEFKFVGLHAPPLVESKEYAKLIKAYGFKESKKEVQHIDIIVTSATCWDDEHSTFRKYMKKWPQCFDKLEKEGCVGDILWLPLAAKNAIDPNKPKIRSMTLFDLNELSGFIRDGKLVLLVLGPCAKCNQTKTGVLKAVLEQENQLITHLVADSRSVRGVVQ